LRVPRMRIYSCKGVIYLIFIVKENLIFRGVRL
jgi:hypothetical protein